MQKSMKIFIYTLIFACLLVLAGCQEPAAEEEPQREPVESPQGYLIRGIIPAVPGEAKRTFSTRLPERDEPAAPVDEPLSVLLIGFDSRGLGDAMVIVSYDPADDSGAIISLKRDIYIDFQTWSEPGRGHNALGWAHYVGSGYGSGDYDGGGAFAVSVVEELLGIELDGYATISFDGFTALIDAIGGVVLSVPAGYAERRVDPIQPGTRRLFGEEALIYARHRQNPRVPEPGSLSEDGDRIRRHQLLLKAILNQAKSLSSNELIHVYQQVEEKIHTNLESWDLLTLANIVFNLNPQRITQVVLPGELRNLHEDKIDRIITYYFLDMEETGAILTELGLKD